jgi:hypothetical protein
MSGALNSVVGGGGGGILSAIGGLVGGAFGGPLGAMIGQAVGNLLQQAIGDAVKDGVGQLQQEHGMPKFVGDLIKDKSDSVLGGLQKHDVPADAQQFAQQEFGGAIDKFKVGFQSDFVSAVLSHRRAGGSEESSDGAGGWLQAIAKAMGQALGDKAKRMVELSADMTQLNAAKSKSTDPETKKAEDAKNAETFNKTMTEFQATGQEYSMLNSVFSTAIKSLGEALSSMARKQ